MERACPGVRLINCFSANVRSVWWMVGGRGPKEALQIGLSRRLAKHDRVVVDKGQVLALFLGESLGHTERRASQ